MISGRMRSAREAVAEVSVRGPGGSSMAVDAIIDTGFTQYLTLPAQLIGQLGLTRQGTVTIVLADGSNKRVPVFNAKVGLGGTFRSVDIEESEGDIILGMGLLYNCRLSIEAIEDGHVFIEVID